MPDDEEYVAPETQPLLSQTDGDNPKPRSSGISPVTLIFPVVLIYRLATILPSTTTIYVINRFACRLWYTLNDPDSIPPGGVPSPEQCSAAGVQRTFSALYTTIAVSDGLGAVISYSAGSHFASRYGRKPFMLVIIAIAMGYGLSLVASTFTSGYLEIILLCSWILCGSFAAPPVFGFAANMFIVDLVTPEERTATMSKLNGWSVFGGAISFTVGGAITTRFQNILVVYCMSAAMFFTTWLYVFSFIPESFSKAKREKLCREREATRAHQASATGTWVEKARHHLVRLIIPEPLKHFAPTCNPVTGKRNWRLLYCAVHIFLSQIADAYGAVSILVFLTARYHYQPEEAGYVLTTLSLVDVFCLTLVIPLLVRRILRPYYLRPKPLRTPSEADDAAVSDTSDRLDVHIAVASWVINAAAYIILGYMSTRVTQICAVIFLGFGCGGGPVARSLVVSTVHPLKQGEALGAVEMVSSIGTLLSPIVMGTIMTSTIATLPQATFWVHGAIVVSAATVVFLVRDSDRYQEKSQGEDGSEASALS